MYYIYIEYNTRPSRRSSASWKRRSGPRGSDGEKNGGAGGTAREGAFGAELTALAGWLSGEGAGAPPAEVEERIRAAVMAEGARFFREHVEWFPQAVQVVDFFHSCEHLCELCRLMHPRDKQAADGLFAMRRRMLKAHGAGCLVRYSEKHAAESPSKDGIPAELSYFRTNLARMEYGKFRKAGLVIGSGVVEGSCRSVVNQRADLSGQRWHPEGALNVLRIRGMIIDGIHAAYWNRRGCRFRQPA